MHRKADYFKPLDECSREEDEDGVSEYDIMIAVSRMPSHFTGKQLLDELGEVVANRTLSTLVDKGIAETYWCPVKQEFAFRDTL